MIDSGAAEAAEQIETQPRMSGQPQVLEVERRGAVTLLRITRPERHNALNAQVLSELEGAVVSAHAEGARAVVLTGAGKNFSAGADLDELTGISSVQAYDILVRGQQVMLAVERSPIPVIAAVNGLALGGGFELVLACTFPVIAEHAQLALPESGLGLLPGYGGTQRLARKVGQAAAAHVMLTGERLTAARAYQLGLTPVEPVAADDLLVTALDLAERVAAQGPRAVRAILTALRLGGDLPIEGGLALESALAGLATGSVEAAEGVSAFRERRRPDFGGGSA